MSALDWLLVKYLRRRGWVVFWLEPEARPCKSVCWLEEYERLRRKS